MKYTQEKFTGERALFNVNDLEIYHSVFEDGESPLKESRDLYLEKDVFKWKYPLWYCDNVEVKDCMFYDTARAGIWYTNHLKVTDTMIEAPKNFRKCCNVVLDNVYISNAEETLWNCSDVEMYNVNARGPYFAMGLKNAKIEKLSLDGNYPFDGAENILVRNSRLMSKDAFWNCKNITIEDSYIAGEYFGWNSENITLKNCTVESLQGFCYIKNLKLIDCELIDTTLGFEYSTVDAVVKGEIASIKNPYESTIRAGSIGEIILQDDKIDVSKVRIITEE